MLDFIKDLIFPKKCLGCGRWGDYFCSDCLNYVLLKNSRICPVCSKSSFGGKTHPGCQKALGLDGLTSVFSYQGILEKAIKKLKYRFVSSLAKDLVELFLSIAGEDRYFVNFVNQGKVVLVPVPLHPRRFRWRGFNQANLLGAMIASNLGITFLPDFLKRTRRTKPQTKLKGKERLRNVKGALVFNKQLDSWPIEQFSTLIFDDVLTTGATLRECCKVLKRKGVKKVWGLTLAR